MNELEVRQSSTESLRPARRLRFMERLVLTISGAAGVLGAIWMLLAGFNAGIQVFSVGVAIALASVFGLRLALRSHTLAALVFGIVSTVAGVVLYRALDIAPDRVSGVGMGASYWLVVVAAWLMAWGCVEQMAAINSLTTSLRALLSVLIPLLFGCWLILLWELLTRGLDVPQVLLPSPSLIGDRLANSTSILWADFRQTFLKAVLIGYFAGCSAGFVVAILIDRSPFLQRGLLPIGNLVSALPIVGVAPIMVMWFGFDWPSKAAVVIIMTFFPMLVNTVSGLAAASHMQLDLMKTYAAGYWQSLFKLRLPEALPFIFNALKINSTLALIGAIVAEFFGTPIVGMGFRISTEVGRMNVDMVWAEIAVAAVAGSLFYGLIALAERFFTFWHPSMR
ncbi:MAG: ABC transporter permease [Granulosicoccus sp.]